MSIPDINLFGSSSEPLPQFFEIINLSSVFFNFVVSKNLTLLIAFGQTIKLVELF